MEYNTGKIIDFDELLKDKERAAKEMSEGSVSLEKLLLQCFDNKIRTISCCAHDRYIVFEVNDDNLEFHMRLQKELKELYNMETITELGESDNRISYEIYGEDDSIFEKISSGISIALQEKNNSESNMDVECAYALLNKIKGIYIEIPHTHNELFKIQSQKENRVPELESYFFVDDYHGNNLYILSRTDIQDVLYSLYHDEEASNDKMGFLSGWLTSLLKKTTIK